jgi:hypothetical protein
VLSFLAGVITNRGDVVVTTRVVALLVLSAAPMATRTMTPLR